MSNNYVSVIRASLSSDDSEKPDERTYTTKHGTQATMNVASQKQADPDVVEFATSERPRSHSWREQGASPTGHQLVASGNLDNKTGHNNRHNT